MAELGQSLGLGGGGGRNSVIARTLQRLVHFDFGRWNTPNELEAFTEVRPLSPRLLRAVPAWTRALHDQLLDAHLEHLATFGVVAPPRPGVDPVALSGAHHVPSRTTHDSPGLAL